MFMLEVLVRKDRKERRKGQHDRHVVLAEGKGSLAWSVLRGRGLAGSQAMIELTFKSPEAVAPPATYTHSSTGHRKTERQPRQGRKPKALLNTKNLL